MLGLGLPQQVDHYPGTGSVTKDQARREVARFIDNYNHRRRHSSCEMLPPVAYEALLAERAEEAAQKDRAA